MTETLGFVWSKYLTEVQANAQAELARKEAKMGDVNVTIERLVNDKANGTMRKVFVAANAIPDPAYRKEVVASLAEQFTAFVPEDVQNEVAFWLKCWDAFTRLNERVSASDIAALKTRINELVELSAPPKVASGFFRADTLEDAEEAIAKTLTDKVSKPDQKLIGDVADELNALGRLVANKDQDGAKMVRDMMAESLLTVMDHLAAARATIGCFWYGFTVKLQEN
jgi:hypothetical protein